MVHGSLSEALELIARIQALKNKPNDEVAAIVQAVVETGRRLREKPTYEHKVSNAVVAIETTIFELANLEALLRELPRQAVDDYNNELFRAEPSMAMKAPLSRSHCWNFSSRNSTAIEVGSLGSGANHVCGASSRSQHGKAT